MVAPRDLSSPIAETDDAIATSLTEGRIAQALIEQDLDRLRAEVDRVLSVMPERRLEARRLITRELEFEPRPEVLQVIVKMAHDNPPGRCRELSRRQLAVWLLIDRELKAVFEPRRIETEILERSRQLLPELRRLAKREEDEFGRVVDELTLSDREFLLPVAEILTPPFDGLLAAEVLVPRLQRFAESAVSGQLGREFPTLSEDEAAGIVAAVNPLDATIPPSRVVVDALAMRTIMHDDLADWEAQQVFDDEDLADHEDCRERLLCDKAAYQVVARRLQEQLDNALIANLEPFAEEMRQVKRNLFSSYLKLSPALRGDADAEDLDEEAQQLLSEDVIEKVREAEQEAERIRSKHVTKEELYLNALSSMRTPVAKPRVQPELVELRRERRRLHLLVGIAVALLIACIAVYLVLPGVSSMRNNVYPSTFQQTLPVTDVTVAGPLVFAEVSSWYWKELGRAEKLHKLEQLGKRAARRDYQVS